MRHPKHNEILNAIKAAVHSIDPRAQVILYGSRARGDAREDSDWDVMVVTDRPKIDGSYY